jgi:hypothetical protein
VARVLADEVCEVAVKNPDAFIRNRRGDAMALQCVFEITQLGGPIEMVIEGECDVLPDFGGMLGVDISISVRESGKVCVVGFGFPDVGHRRENVTLLQHLGSLSPV